MTAPERICLLPDDGWSWVKGPKPPYEENAIEYTRSDLIPTAAYVAGLEAALRRCLTAIDHADMKDGVCCCGDDMLHHESPMNCGHNPRDSGEYNATMVVAMAEKALSARPDAPDVRVVTVAQLERDKAELQKQLNQLLTIIDDWDSSRAVETGGFTMHVYGQTPDWFVDAAHWACYGYGYDDQRAILAAVPQGEKK